jgi:iron(III) transport system substrate-binding protein
MHPQERALYEAAKREAEVTWYSGQYSAEPSEAAGRAFTARYPSVRCNVVRTTSQVAFQRLSQDARAGVGQCDVFSSTNGGHYIQLKRQNRLMQFRPVNADGLLPILRLSDPDNYFQSSFIGIDLEPFHAGCPYPQWRMSSAPPRWMRPALARRGVGSFRDGFVPGWMSRG